MFTNFFTTNTKRLRVVVFAILIPFAPVANLSSAASLDEWLPNELTKLEELYRHFHQHPELSFHERQTAARLGDELETLGATVTRNVGGHGIVALLENGQGPTVMVRTDLDGLPVIEKTGLVYASKVQTQDDSGNDVGVMHACGHDVHITCLIGVARYLAANRSAWQGTLMLIGQPAEERGAGAAAMLGDGLFERFPRPDAAIALHVDSALAAGQVGYRPGYALANVDSVDITLRGRGGHGAYPHTTIDPIVQAAQLVMSLQTIVSREVKPTEPAVVTVGSIHAGTKHNVISANCKLQLTVRSYSDKVRQQVISAIERKTRAVAEGAGASEPEIVVSEGTPALYNDPAMADRIGETFRQTLGDTMVVETDPSMGGEDFSRYGRAGVPILMFRLGTVEQTRLDHYRHRGQQPPSLHSAEFYPDAELTLKTGIKAMSAAVLHLFAEPPTKGE